MWYKSQTFTFFSCLVINICISYIEVLLHDEHTLLHTGGTVMSDNLIETINSTLLNVYATASTFDKLFLTVVTYL